MKFFFTGSVRGGRAHQPEYAALVSLLQKHGEVLSAHVADETISAFGETDLSKEQIHDRELQALRQGDVVIAEVSTPSLGVGYVIAKALEFEKPVICLYQGEEPYQLSAMIKGNRNVEVLCYREMGDLKERIEELSSNKAQLD